MTWRSRNVPRDQLIVRHLPFRHVIFASLLSRHRENGIIEDLEGVDWKTHSGSFFRFKIPARNVIREHLVDRLRDVFLSKDMITQLESIFECNLGEDVRLEVHKYAAGDGIGVHTDRVLPEIRYVLNLNRSWRMEDGGIWILAGDASLRASATYLPALSNTGFVFSTCDQSFHALSKYNGKEIYCLVVCIPRSQEKS